MLLFIAVFVPFIASKPGLSPVRIIIVGFMMLWEAWGIFHFCKLLLGKEIIEVGKDFILVSSRVIGFARAKKYSTKLIRDIRALPNPYSQEYRTWPRAEIWWDKGDGTIAF